MATASAKNGSTYTTSTRFSLPCCHQTRPSRSKGIGATTVLLSNARRKVSSARPYHRHEEEWDDGQDGSADPTGDRHSATQERLARKKNIARTFFPSAIQATDSTLTGCTAKKAAANQAPGTFRRASRRHNRAASMACKS